MNNMKIVEQRHDYHPYDHHLEITSTCSQCGHSRGYTELHEDHVHINANNKTTKNLSVSITCMECGHIDAENNPEWQVIDNKYVERHYFSLEPSETEDTFDLSFD